MKKTTKISIVLDAVFKSAKSFERFLHRKPHWASYNLKEDLYYEIIVDCTLREGRDINYWKQLQDALEGNALCWDVFGNMRIIVDYDFIGFKNGAFNKFCYSLYRMIPSKVHSIFGRHFYLQSEVQTLLSDLSTLGIGPESCPEIKQLIGKKIVENCDSNIEPKDGRLHIKNLRATMSSQRLAGIVEFLDVVRRYCKGTSWKTMDSINIYEYLCSRVKSDFLKTVF